eukprot:TRINITY_DN41273_c0_g1_i1.p3 TRINITY_DN41273_c0_g1~~TRINITY_DN41273_c0_g1_i1.p3  ORF type:complete len:136 (-),score=9.97 TRINITY_DN41273_c0_g1_i1:80-487(-)
MPNLFFRGGKEKNVKRSGDEIFKQIIPQKRRKNSFSNYSTLFSDEIYIDAFDLFGSFNETVKHSQIDMAFLHQWDELLLQLQQVQNMKHAQNVQHVYSNALYYRLLLRVLYNIEFSKNSQKQQQKNVLIYNTYYA